VSQHAKGKLAGHDFGAGGPVIEGRDQRKDRGTGIGGTVHVADMDLVERRLAHAENEWTLLLKADIGGAFDEVRSHPVGNASQGSDAAGNDDHGVSGIRTAGNVRPDIGIVLRHDLARSLAEHLADQILAASSAKFFGQNAQCAVGGDEVNQMDAGVAVYRHQKLAQEQRATGSGSRDGQISMLRIGQRSVPQPERIEPTGALSIGSAPQASQGDGRRRSGRRGRLLPIEASKKSKNG